MVEKLQQPGDEPSNRLTTKNAKSKERKVEEREARSG
jgi:hypothetical protein